MTVKKWEIHWAHVVFEDSDEVKRRPVLIIDESSADGELDIAATVISLAICKVSS